MWIGLMKQLSIEVSTCTKYQQKIESGVSFIRLSVLLGDQECRFAGFTCPPAIQICCDNNYCQPCINIHLHPHEDITKAFHNMTVMVAKKYETIMTLLTWMIPWTKYIWNGIRCKVSQTSINIPVFSIISEVSGKATFGETYWRKTSKVFGQNVFYKVIFEHHWSTQKRWKRRTSAYSIIIC